MSDRKYTLFIEPKLFEPKDAEHFKFTGMDCPSCDNGYIKVFEDYLQLAPAETEKCQRCAGTGKLMADVVIRWKPDEPKIEG